MKQFKFNVPQNIELTKAREIYEQSLLLVQEHVRNGTAFIFVNGKNIRRTSTQYHFSMFQFRADCIEELSTT